MKDYFIIKKSCQMLFWSGGGNYWYEVGEIGDDSSALYVACSAILFFAYISMSILEIMAATIGDFPEDEHGDSVSLGVSHTIVLLKLFSVMLNKGHLRKLLKEIVHVCDDYEGSELITRKYKIIKMNVIGYVMNVFVGVMFFIFEGIRKVFVGSHFVTVVTYYPQFEDDSYLAIMFRVYTTFVLSLLMVSMISMDCFILIYLIIFKYKLVTLRHYFNDLSRNVENMVLRNSNNLELPTDYLSNGLVVGVKMHQRLLRLSKEFYECFGTAITLQFCLSVGSIVSLLLQIALSKDVTFMSYIKILFFLGALYSLLALFLCNAGEITYEASLLSDAIYFSGWHLCKVQSNDKRNLRHIVLMSCVQAQRPLVMKALKMVDLTYATFLQVSRLTYSLFALLNTQNK